MHRCQASSVFCTNRTIAIVPMHFVSYLRECMGGWVGAWVLRFFVVILRVDNGCASVMCSLQR